MNAFTLLAIFVLFTIVDCCKSDENIVTTPLGKIQGTVITSRKGEEILSFLGVRYAEPPVGELRFQPPVPVKPWNGTYDATKDAPFCPQSFVTDAKEDCLFLNVYTKKLPNKSNNIKTPVLVFFHPGGFYEGTSSSEHFGPQYLLDQDIVLVFPNYRLQTLGFLATGTKEAPGNNGLKDQVQVLRWIQQNIASFGGDPNDVTIGGYSAGGASVTFHLVSPMSKGLFHKAIAMSGSGLGIQPIENDLIKLAKKQGELVNCPQEPISELVNCLKGKTADELTKNFEAYQEFIYDPIWIWFPVIEKDFGQERFLIEHPIKSILNNRVADVPVLMGVTTDEFGGRSHYVVNNETALKQFDDDYKTVWPILSGYERNTPFSFNVSEGLRKFYFPDNTIDVSKRQNIADLYADTIISFGVNRGAKLLSEHLSSKVYYYQFNFKGNYSFFYIPNSNKTVYGVSHHDDLLYLYHIPPVAPLFTDGDEGKMVDLLTTIWGSFIKTGDPNTNNYHWPEFNVNDQQYLEITLEPNIKSFMFRERYETYEKLFPISMYLN